MERVAVESGTLASVGYDPTSSELEVEFRAGRIYLYSDVPAAVHAWLMRSPSKGSYFNRMIRDRYSFRDVTPGPTGDLLDELRRSLERDRK